MHQMVGLPIQLLGVFGSRGDGESDNRLRFSAVEYFKIIFGEAAQSVSPSIADDNRNQNEIDRTLERRCLFMWCGAFLRFRGVLRQGGDGERHCKQREEAQQTPPVVR